MATGRTLDAKELRRIDAYWRACNYLAAGMIYLQDNPLLREPLQARAHQEPAARSLGREPGPRLHLRAPEPADQEVRPRRDLPRRSRPRRARRAGARLPRGHLRRDLPEQGRGRSRACGSSSRSSRSPAASAATARPRRRDRSTRAANSATASRTRSARRSTIRTCWWPWSSATANRRPGPLATAWHSNKFLNPVRDGAVLPVLHLNGYKINNPTILARISHEELDALFRGYGWTPHFVEGDDPDDDAPG